jgi:hypothetical protein
MAGGSASALSLSRPAQASLALRPAGLLSRPRRPLSRGSSPSSYPAKPLVSYQINRQLSGWNPPSPVFRAFGAHGQQRTHAVQQGRHPVTSTSPKFLQRLENCSNEVLDRRLRQTELAADLLVALSCIMSFSTSSCCWVRPRRLLTISYSTLWPSLRKLRPACSTAEIGTNMSLAAPWG